MGSPDRPLRLRARLSLLLAALLYFAGAVAGPALHSHPTGSAEAAAGVPVLTAAKEHTGSGPQPGDGSERSCALCHLLGAGSLPAFGAALPLAAEGCLPQPVLPAAQLSCLDPAPARARDPPAPRLS